MVSNDCSLLKVDFEKSLLLELCCLIIVCSFKTYEKQKASD